MADKKKLPKAGDLRIWWIPQVPMKPFHWSVKNLREGKNLLDCLAEYDRFQYENRVKPDYCNAGGLQIFENGDWSDWYHPKTGESLEDFLRD